MNTINYETFNEFMDALRMIILKCTISGKNEFDQPTIQENTAREIVNLTKEYGVELLGILGIDQIEL